MESVPSAKRSPEARTAPKVRSMEARAVRTLSTISGFAASPDSIP